MINNMPTGMDIELYKTLESVFCNLFGVDYAEGDIIRRGEGIFWSDLPGEPIYFCRVYKDIIDAELYVQYDEETDSYNAEYAVIPKPHVPLVSVFGKLEDLTRRDLELMSDRAHWRDLPYWVLDLLMRDSLPPLDVLREELRDKASIWDDDYMGAV